MLWDMVRVCVVRVEECVPLCLRQRVPGKCPVAVCGVGEAGLVAVDQEVHNLCTRGMVWLRVCMVRISMD